MRHTDPGSGPRCVSSDGSVVPVSSFTNHRLLWVSYPAFYRYYEDTKTAFAHLAAFAFRSALITSIAFSFLATASEKRACDLGSCCAGMIRSGTCRGDRRLSQLPWSPYSSLCPALRPRADLHARPYRRLGVAPVFPTTKAPPFKTISRLYHTASRPAAYA